MGLPPDVTQRLRKDATQERSQTIVRSLVQATREILEREGPAALTTNRVADVAGVSVGSLYHYFESKERLVEAIFAADEAEAYQQNVAWAEHALHLPLEEMIRFYVVRVAEHRRRFLQMHEAFYRERHAHSDARRRGDAVSGHEPGAVHPVEGFLRAWFEAHPDEVRPSREAFEWAAFLVDRVGYEMMRVTVDERPGYLGHDGYVEEMVQLLVRYLRP